MLITIIRKLTFFLCLFIACFITATANAYNCPLSLSGYLAQVRINNLGHTGSALIAAGAKQRIGEGKLVYQPSLFAEGQYVRDSFNTEWAPVAGESRSIQSYKLGVSQDTPLGVQGKVYYNYQQQSVNGISPLTSQSSVTGASPIAEINIPLSRNLIGRETRATAKIIDAQAKRLQFSENYKNQQLMAQAETAYWRLAIARTIAGKQQQSLQRAVKIQTWVAKRTSLRLAESADLLQAEAAVQSKKLDLQNAVNEQQLAALNFNTLRGSCEINVSERLCSYHEDLVFTLPLPCRPGLREDVKIAEQEEKIKIANAQLGIEKNKPILDLYASYALNGKNPSSNLAIAESFTADYPSTAVGLRLSMPLNFSRLAKDRAAYRKEMCGAKYEYQQKVYDNFREWELLTAKIQNLSNRLNITAKLASIEFGKLQAEQDRLKYGKTTTYQVLVFEQEYANSQIASLLLQAEILELRAQLKTFGV